jgi:methionyl-tRNA formyltransferase
LSNELLVEYLPKYIAGAVQARSQPHPDRATYSRKLTKMDGNLDWAKPANQLECEIRAFSEWPKSHAHLAGKDVIITKAHVELSENGTQIAAPGMITVSDQKELLVQTGNGVLVIDNLKPAGGKEMTARAFLAGHPNIT